jgi:hypothetical protein
MQEPRKQPDPPAREKSVQDLERERIADEYDKRNRKGIYGETTDPDSDEYYLDPAEKAQLYSEKLAAEKGETAQGRRKEVMERVYGKGEAEPEADDDAYDLRPTDQAAFEEFQERHPELSEADWKAMNKETFILTAPDLVELREKARASGSKADIERLLERAADAYATAKQAAERRAYVQYRQSQQPHNRINDEVMKMHKFMEKRSKV